MSNYMNPVNRVAGLVSGLETQKIIADLMRVARIPLDRLLQQKQRSEWKQEDYRQKINRSLLDFRTNYASLVRLQGTFQVKTAASSNEAAVTATPTSAAQPGTYAIKVTQLAEVASDVSGSALSLNSADKIDPDAALESQKSKFANPWGATTTLELKITTYDPDGTLNSQTFTVDTAVDSLNDVLARINAGTSLGVTAFYESSTDKVVISTKRTGDYSTNEIEIEDVADTFARGTLSLSATAQGKNAVVDINGLTGIQQYENTFTLNNVTFSLKKTTGTDSVLVTITSDTDEIFDTIKNFIEQYNSLIETINEELTEERYPNYLPLTAEQKEQLTDKQIEQWEEKARSGLLRNDPILRDVVYHLRRALTTPVSGLEKCDSIFDIGIGTGFYWEGGKLYVNEEKLREAISSDPEAVMNLFTASGDAFETQGLGVRVYNELNNAIDQITGQAGYPDSFSLYDNSFISRQIRDLNDRIQATEEHLAKLEDRYWRQFTALESALAAMQAQSNWLMMQAAQMGGWNE